VTTGASFSGSEPIERREVRLFDASLRTVVGYGFDRGALATTAMRALSTARFPTDRTLLCEYGNVTTLFAPDDAKGYKLFNKAGAVLLANADTKAEYAGRGLPLNEPFHFPVTPTRSALDLQVLNQHRLGILLDNRINQESLQVLDGQAKDLLEDAARRGTSAGLAKKICDEAVSAALSRRAYGPLVGVMNDLVTAVVLLLLLAIPFAYALERLLIGTPHIYRQIGWFAIFFVLTFAVLYFVNPAFRIASMPVIIFLAFAIILLSSLVIFIMVRKLQTEVRKMQGLATTVHSADVSRLSTMMAAVNMGISTMRRRPLRTTLTALTVVLLTFTILTFASFGSSWGLRRTYEAPMGSGPPRVLVRQQLWSPIAETIGETLRGHFGGEALVVPRYWVAPTAQQAQDAMKNSTPLDVLLSDDTTERLSPIAAAVGLDGADLQRQQDLAELLEGRLDLLEGDGIFLTDAVRDALGLTDEDIGTRRVLLKGMPFTYAGRVREQMGAFTMLEGSSMLPVDYQSTGGASLGELADQYASADAAEQPDVESAQFVTFQVDRVVVISPQRARALGGRIRSLLLYPEKIEDIDAIAEQAARVSQLPTYVGQQGGVYRLIFTSLTKASGWRDLLVPVLLGGMIVFATMLGSVSDREKEIYTFSSLGLAPAHVAGLFFAEASMYAVLGGMGGYLLGQAVARGLAWVGGMLNWSVPTMNYSSTNAIVTILIVMGTVLVSTIYPAMKASRSANPGVQRSWRIPKPRGNLYDLLFPFTVSTYDITGVVSFLKEHFDNYADTSVGNFAAMESRIFRQRDNDMLGFGAKVALAPFDLGVTQEFALLSQPSEIEGIDEVRILIYRLSGAQGDWQRSNRVFIHELRKQLLIWRALPHEIMDKYRSRTLETWDRLPVERVDDQSIGASA